MLLAYFVFWTCRGVRYRRDRKKCMFLGDGRSGLFFAGWKFEISSWAPIKDLVTLRSFFMLFYTCFLGTPVGRIHLSDVVVRAQPHQSVSLFG